MSIPQALVTAGTGPAAPKRAAGPAASLTVAAAADPASSLPGLDTLIGAMTQPSEIAELVADTLTQAFLLFTEQSQAQRRDPFGLSISALGGCARQAAYRLAGTEPSDPELALTGEHRAANLGTMMHRGLLPLMAHLLGGQAEVPVTLIAGDDSIPGTADLRFARTVLDAKTVRESRLTRAITGGPYTSNRIQTLAYALGFHQQGIDIDWVVYLYLDRSTGQEHPIAERFTRAAMLEVLRRVWAIQTWRRYPDRAPRTERGPGHSWACDSCPFLTRCWGAGARPRLAGPQRQLGRDHGQLSRVLLRYAALGAEAGEIKKEREFLKAVLTHGSRPGNYGDLRWYRTRGADEPDTAAMVAILEELGIPVPMRPKKGQVRVGPAKPPNGQPARPGRRTGRRR